MVVAAGKTRPINPAAHWVQLNRRQRCMPELTLRPRPPAAAVAAAKLREAVLVQNERLDDLVMTGGREEMIAQYEASFEADGHITALRMELPCNMGWCATWPALSSANQRRLVVRRSGRAVHQFQGDAGRVAGSKQ